MAVELEIKFDGAAPGVAEHRLSIAAFGDPLERLLAAIRRIASGAVREAIGPEYGGGGGRYTRKAALLDVQIAAIEEGSLKLSLVLALQLTAGQQGDLFDDLPERTGREFIAAVASEGDGHPRSMMVRRYLEALPGDVTQAYVLRKDGETLGTATVGAAPLMGELTDLPGVMVSTGKVVGVTFAPAKPEVRVRTGAHTLRFSASADQVDRALELRDQTIAFLGIGVAKMGRLVSVSPSDHREAPPPDEQLAEHLFTRWNGLLERLAR